MAIAKTKVKQGWLEGSRLRGICFIQRDSFCEASRRRASVSCAEAAGMLDGTAESAGFSENMLAGGAGGRFFL